MRRLVCDFVVRKPPKTGLLTLRLKYFNPFINWSFASVQVVLSDSQNNWSCHTGPLNTYFSCMSQQIQIFTFYSQWDILLSCWPFISSSIDFRFMCRVRSGSVVECLTRDRGDVGSSLTDVTAVCPWARHINPSIVLVHPRKTRPYITERLLMGRKESNQTNKSIHVYFSMLSLKNTPHLLLKQYKSCAHLFRNEVHHVLV